jgi:hypothetical protein
VKVKSMKKIIILITLILIELYFHATKDIPYPTPSTEGEALFNLFIRDNYLLIPLVIYLIVSFIRVIKW